MATFKIATIAELLKALEAAQNGDIIICACGTYETPDSPIPLPAGVKLEGQAGTVIQGKSL